jgi:cell division protein FtsW
VKLLRLIPFFDPSVENWATEARLLWWMTFLWLFAGLAVMFSASYASAAVDPNVKDGLYFFKAQLVWITIGLCLFTILVRIPLRSTLKIASIGLFFALILLFATHTSIGETRNESTRWIKFGSFLIQPSELIKPFLVLQAAQLFGHWTQTKWQAKVFWLSIFAISLAGILLQPSLSMTALCGITLWLIALGAGLPMPQLLGTAALGIVVAVGSIATKSYQLKRIMSFLNPWLDQAGDGYQLVQSLMAIGSGGITGKGFGLSQQKLFLPIQDTDFIFAVFAEEFGLIGSVVLIVMILIFGAIGLRVALKSENRIVRLVAIGTTVLLVGQSFINIGVATGVLPTTGLPFPLISYGGSSMLSSLVITGILVRSAREMSSAEVIPLHAKKIDAPPEQGEPREQRQARLAARRKRSSIL